MKTYYLSSTSNDAHKRWSPTRPIMPDMRQLMDSVAELLDAGLFYTKDIHAGIITNFHFTEEELSRGSKEVEGGVVGMEIYYARKRVEKERLAAKEAQARNDLAPVVGKKLGSLRFAGMTSTLRNVHIAEVKQGTIIIEGAAGNKRKQYSTTCLSIKKAMKLATESVTY